MKVSAPKTSKLLIAVSDLLLMVKMKGLNIGSFFIKPVVGKLLLAFGM
jgi:hypothetical protein